MTEQELAQRIKDRLDKIGTKYETKGEQLLYEQGVLLGLLARLSLKDSDNLSMIMNTLKSLGD